MKNQGIILYGSDPNKNITSAYKMAIEYMNLDQYSQKHVFSNTYPNFLFIKKIHDKNEISIEDSRNIIEFLSQKPTLIGKRAVIIDSAENMSRNAANSILKILEEPPIDSILILTSNNLLYILPTIRSRCIKIHIPSEGLKISDSNSSKDYIASILKDVDQNFIYKTVEFLESDFKNINDFAKQNSERYDDFFNVAISYNGYISFKKGCLKSANNLLELQKLYTLSKNTYPDKKNLIIAACYILQK